MKLNVVAETSNERLEGFILADLPEGRFELTRLVNIKIRQLYDLLVVRRGWTVDGYAGFVTTGLKAALLPG